MRNNIRAVSQAWKLGYRKRALNRLGYRNCKVIDSNCALARKRTLVYGLINHVTRVTKP